MHRVVALSLAALLGLVLSVPSGASACTPPEPGTVPIEHDAVDPCVAGLIAVGSVDLVFIGLDVGFAAAGERFPAALAVLELVLAGLPNIGIGTGYIIAGIIQTGDGSACGGDLGYLMASTGFAMAGLGAWFLGHAIRWLLEQDDEPSLLPITSIRPESMVVGLVGRFD